MSKTAALLKEPPALPATMEDLLAQRRLKQQRTINDLVEDIMVKLWDDKQFQKWLDAVDDSRAVEGALDIDDTEVARMIREAARHAGNDEVGHKNLAEIRHATRVVLRRYGQARNQRRDMIGGEVISSNGG